MSAVQTEYPNPVETMGEPSEVVTYPISVEYVQQWDLPRALAEAVSNAIDADPGNFLVHYDADLGELVIEDQAEDGVGVEAMVFGWSDKRGRDGMIGQFGEGLKIATIRGVSDPQVRYMVIESVGMTIVPKVSEHRAVSGLNVPVKSDKAPKVLSWGLYPSTRSRGTLVRVGVPLKVAQKVMSRFRHLTVPDYDQPSGAGEVLTDEPGRIYIGGVYVTTVPNLTYGYDFSLATAKRFQNRDRTIIESWALTQAIRQVQSQECSAEVLLGWARRALDGELPEQERNIIHGAADAERRRSWFLVAGLLLGDPKRHYYRASTTDAEASLVLNDESMVEITPRGARHDFEALMRVLGVSQAKEVVNDPERRKQDVTWVKPDKKQAQAIEQAVTLLRQVYGEQAVGQVKVYSEIVNCSTSHVCGGWLGFYRSTGKGLIALSVDVLDDPESLWETLFHETAHRIAHRGTRLVERRSEYGDRSRGFEATLGAMGTMLLRYFAEHPEAVAVLNSGPIKRPDMPHHAPVPAGLHVSFGPDGKYGTTESRYGNLVRKVVMLGVQDWCDKQEQAVTARRSATLFAEEHYVRASDVRMMSQRLFRTKVDFQIVHDVCAGVEGANSGALWWLVGGVPALWLCRGPNSRKRVFSNYARAMGVRAMEQIEADSRYSDLAPALWAIIEGESDPRPEWHDDGWLAPVDDLARRVADELATRDLRPDFEERAHFPTDADPARAWEKYLDRKNAREAR